MRLLCLKIPWNLLFIASTKLIISRYDSDHQRSKNTTRIGYVHRTKDKKYEGYFNGQNLFFLLLITDQITFPVGFSFYEPDPALKACKSLFQRL